MKNKKITALISTLAVTLSACAFAVTAGAEETVMTQEILTEALNKGGTVKLTNDLEGISTIDIISDVDVTLDLNGHSISTGLMNPDRHYYAIDNYYGTLTLTDSVGTGEIIARGIENKTDKAKMIIEGGTYVSCDKNGGAAVWIDAGDVTINGGIFKTEHVGSSGDQVGIGCVNNSGNLTITGGTFNDVNARTYAIISTGNIEITPADGKEVNVWGKHGGLAIDAGTAIVNGGNFVSEDYYGLYVSNDGHGEDPMQAVVTVNGGTFNGKSYSVWVGSDYNNPVNSTICINSGTFLKPLNRQSVTRDNAIVVFGGTFSSDVSDYVSLPYECKQDNDVYVVSKMTGTPTTANKLFTDDDSAESGDAFESVMKENGFTVEEGTTARADEITFSSNGTEISGAYIEYTITTADKKIPYGVSFDFANVNGEVKLGILLYNIPENVTVNTAPTTYIK